MNLETDLTGKEKSMDQKLPEHVQVFKVDLSQIRKE